MTFCQDSFSFGMTIAHTCLEMVPASVLHNPSLSWFPFVYKLCVIFSSMNRWNFNILTLIRGIYMYITGVKSALCVCSGPCTTLRFCFATQASTRSFGRLWCRSFRSLFLDGGAWPSLVCFLYVRSTRGPLV